MPWLGSRKKMGRGGGKQEGDREKERYAETLCEVA